MGKNVVLKTIAFILPLLIISDFLYLKSFRYELYDYLISEDSISEYLQAIAYFSSGVIFILIAIRLSGEKVRLQKILFLFAGLGVLLIAMEEISWGQRLFGIKTPEWFQSHNIQNELSIHNLEPIQKTIHFFYSMTGFFFSFGWIPFRYNFLNKKLPPVTITILRVIKPQWYLVTYFLPLFFFYTYLILTGSPGNYFTFNDQEIPELLLSLGMLLYSYLILRSLNKRLSKYSVELHG